MSVNLEVAYHMSDLITQLSNDGWLVVFTDWFRFVSFYGISTFVGYLMPKLVYTYISNIYMICKHIFRLRS